MHALTSLGHPIAGGLSLAGLSWPDADAEDPDGLLALLDDALYESKRRGRNTVTMVSTHPQITATAH